jgi:hypothetical protein
MTTNTTTHRAKITELAENCVKYSRWNEVFERYDEFEFYAPVNGGYVRYYADGAHGSDHSQICERLCVNGPTLMWAGKHPLVDLIRDQHTLWMYDNRWAR